MSIHTYYGEAQSALILANLGMLAAPEPSPMRAFLCEFLSDRRVIEMSPFLWRPILEGITLRVRPRGVAGRHRSIWMDEDSSLMYYTHEQVRLPGERLPDVHVEAVMCYRWPPIGLILNHLHADGMRRVVVLPAYP